ncbi:MAG: hypothetical protein J6W41_01160 [Alphaproteobacteria bacterium]|nr:hypothetical protein [Alphaproteobacteria bacterium]
MSTSEAKFHESRRIFIINPDLGLVIAPSKTNISHVDMIYNMGFNDKQYANVVLNKIPRGYYMKGELCVYQGVYKPTWELAQSNYQIVQQYIPDLRALFNLTDDSNMYLGVRVGKIGEVWERINKTTIGEFMRMR